MSFVLRLLGLAAVASAVLLGTAGPAAAQATTYYWNASGGAGGGDGTWDTTTANWNDQPTWNGTQTVWPNTATSNATFNSATAYTVTLGLSLTAGNVDITAGSVTFSNAGNFTLTATQFNVSSGASATINGTNFFKNAGGPTALNVDGNLTFGPAQNPGGGRLTTLTGSGTITIGGGIRIGGNTAAQVFSGSMVDIGTAAPGDRAAFNLNGTSNAVLRLSGNNLGATGDFLVSSGNSNNAIRLESANAISSASAIRVEGGTNNVVELAFGDITRSTTGATSGGGGFNLSGTNVAGGFAALGADRSVTLVGGGQIVWGTQGFNPTSNNGNSFGFQLGGNNATHKTTLVNDVNLNGGAAAVTRGFFIGNGSAAIDAEIPGVISDNGTVQATLRIGGQNGSRVVISGTNTFGGNVDIGGDNGGPFVRPTTAAALGSATSSILIRGNGNTGGLELLGGLTITKSTFFFNGRAADQSPGIINVSGDNTLTGNITGQTGGSFISIQSDSGLLTLSGNFAYLAAATGGRRLNLGGASDGVLNGTLTGPSVAGTQPAALQLVKYGSGTWTLGGTVTLTNGAGVPGEAVTTTTIGNSYDVLGGTLLINGGFTANGASTAAAVRTGATLGGTGNVGGTVSVDAGGAVRGGAPGGTGTLTVPANVTINSTPTSNGILRVEASRVTAGNANASLLSVTTGGILNLNPGSGNKFTIDLVNGASSLNQGETYTITLATVDTPGNIQLNGASLGASATIDPANFTLQSSAFAGFSGVSLGIDGTGTALVLIFTPVPEPAWLLAVAGGAWLGLRRRRRGNPVLVV